MLNDEPSARLKLMKREEGSWHEKPGNGHKTEIDRGGAHLSLGWDVGTGDEVIVAHVFMRDRDLLDFDLANPL